MFLHRSTLVSAVVAFASGLEILLDDAGQHVRPGPAWTKAEGTCAQGGYAGGFHHNKGVHDDGHFATWNFSVATDGCYWVEEFHPDASACDFSLSSRVPVVIHFCKGLQTAGIVDQSQRAGQWNKLLRLPFYVGHSAAIHLSAMGMDFEAAGVWAADAFRLTWHSKSCHQPEAEQDEAVAPPEDAEVEEVTKQVQAELALQEGKEAANFPERNAQALVDDADSKVLGATLEPVLQCPVTASSTFHHDGLQKDRRAQATFNFDPPHDGCYLIEELHPKLEECKASANTKVHINYCRGLQAAGTVDQTANAGQWAFVAALPFYAGHPGNVTVSNEGTEPGTLTVFNQVRFTWSGKSCRQVESHPRKAEIRITVDFKNVADRLPEFRSTLRSKLAVLASVPEKSFRLTGLRSGSIIAEFLLLPSVVDEPLMAGFSAVKTMEKLRSAVAEHSADLCALAEPGVQGCKVEFKDLGRAMPSVRPVPKQRPQQQQEEAQASEPEGTANAGSNLVAIVALLVVFTLVKLAFCCYINKSRKAKREAGVSTDEASKVAESEVTASMEEGKALDQEKPIGKPMEKHMEELSDNNSTLAPSSDKQDEPSLHGDDEQISDLGDDEKRSDLGVLRALSDQSI